MVAELTQGLFFKSFLRNSQKTFSLKGIVSHFVDGVTDKTKQSVTPLQKLSFQVMENKSRKLTWREDLAVSLITLDKQLQITISSKHVGWQLTIHFEWCYNLHSWEWLSITRNVMFLMLSDLLDRLVEPLACVLVFLSLDLLQLFLTSSNPGWRLTFDLLQLFLQNESKYSRFMVWNIKSYRYL